MSYKPADSKREEFRKYLEKSGVLDALTKTLVCLYEEPEKPNNALDFLRKNISMYYNTSFFNLFTIILIFRQYRSRYTRCTRS